MRLRLPAAVGRTVVLDAQSQTLPGVENGVGKRTAPLPGD